MNTDTAITDEQLERLRAKAERIEQRRKDALCFSHSAEYADKIYRLRNPAEPVRWGDGIKSMVCREK